MQHARNMGTMSVHELSDRSAEAARTSTNAPIIVIAFAGSGAERLRSALSGYRELACTQQTGILPLFHKAFSTWQAVDGRVGSGVSPMAAASLRALSAGLMTSILARQHGRRWCEFATAPPAAAQTFALLYPQTRFLIVHRRADTVARAIVEASDWGLEGPEFAPFVSAHPGSPVAALASYWVAHAAQQLEFEQAHQDRCHRLRIEDLSADPAQALQGIRDFLALDEQGAPPGTVYGDDSGRSAAASAAGTGLPTDRIPAALLDRVNELHRALGYSPVTDAGA
jgi:protein-tyrosine sulfotransferase